MLGAGQDLLCRPRLHNLATVHDHHPIAHLRDDPEVVRNEEESHSMSTLQADEQIQDLRLNRHVERRGRLVGDQ